MKRYGKKTDKAKSPKFTLLLKSQKHMKRILKSGLQYCWLHEAKCLQGGFKHFGMFKTIAHTTSWSDNNSRKRQRHKIQNYTYRFTITSPHTPSYFLALKV